MAQGTGGGHGGQRATLPLVPAVVDRPASRSYSPTTWTMPVALEADHLAEMVPLDEVQVGRHGGAHVGRGHGEVLRALREHPPHVAGALAAQLAEHGVAEDDVVAIEWKVDGEPTIFTLGVGPWISVGWTKYPSVSSQPPPAKPRTTSSWPHSWVSRLRRRT